MPPTIQTLNEHLQHQQFWKAQRGRYRKATKRIDQTLARQAEAKAARILAGRGWQTWHIASTEPNKRFDLYARGARVEVKASGYHPAMHGCRYQAHIHNHANLILLACFNHTIHWFVIPASEIGQRRNIAVWSHDPACYTGIWSQFYEAWHLADEIIQAAPAIPLQLPLPLEMRGETHHETSISATRF